MSTAAATLDYGRNVEKIFGSCSWTTGPRRLAAVLHCPGAMATATALRVYRPREARQTVLHQVVEKYLPEFIEQAEMNGHSVPAFVQGELEALIACGDPAQGFTHLKCPRCGHDRFLPFSCKSRVCSSCAGRRMKHAS